MWFAILIVGVIACSGLGLFFLIRTLIDRMSGWNDLASSYRAKTAPAAWDWKHQTVRVGSVRYRRSMRIAVRPEGLYLDEAGMPRHPVLCIPWQDLRNPTSSRLYGWPAVRVSAGPGAVEFPAELYQSVMRLAHQITGK